MLQRWNPLDEMNALLLDMDRLFRRSFSSEPSGSPKVLSGTSEPTLAKTGRSIMTSFVPPVEVFKRDNQLVVRAELPGVDPQHVKVELLGNELHISGERKDDQETKRDNYYLSETTYGRFERWFTVPDGIKPDEVKASFKNGILEIALPEKGLAQAHRVKIEGVPETKQVETKSH